MITRVWVGCYDACIAHGRHRLGHETLRQAGSLGSLPNRTPLMVRDVFDNCDISRGNENLARISRGRGRDLSQQSGDGIERTLAANN